MSLTHVRPRCFSSFLVMVLPAVMFLVGSAICAGAEPAPDLAKIREKIATEGLSFTVDDHFTRTVTPQMRTNLRGFRPPKGYEEELEQHLKILPVAKANPISMDWRDVGGITRVKNQGTCGSCWAFAASAQMEAFVKIYYGEELDISEQQVIDCNPYGDDCNGGTASAAYYVFTNYGAVLESCNPYLNSPPGCNQEQFKPYATITDWNYILNDLDQIKTALQTGPVCTGIDASAAFEAYASGCFDEVGSQVNHLVLIVGYDDRACGGAGAWYIKNSWGLEFGEGGYITVQYGAARTGSMVTQMVYAPPPVEITLDPGLGSEPLIADQATELTWSTSGASAATVDIWLGVDGICHDILVAENVPNTGSTIWYPPNHGTDYASLVVIADGDTEQGYAISPSTFGIVGHKLRYVSTAGSATAPYETPATAAHSIADAVNACTGTDTVLVVGGDYVGSTTITRSVTVRGGWNSDFSVQDPDLWPTRYQGAGTALRFFGSTTGNCGVDGVTFHDGLGATYGAPVGGRHGGAIFSQEASPTIRNCIFENNRGDPGTGTAYGGAVCLVGGSPVVEDCVFTGNLASRGGALGVFAGGMATLTGNVFTGNTCTDSSAVNLGAAVCVENATCLIEGGSITDNGSTGRGGGVAAVVASVELVDVSVTGNRAFSGGGGIYADSSTVTLRGTVVRGNTLAGGGGGGLEFDDSVLDLRNSRFGDNVAVGMGGGISGFGMSGVVENCVVDGNVAGSVGGVAVFASGSAVLRNTIVTGNQGGGLMFGGAEVVADYNNVWDNSGGDYVSMSPGPNDVSMDPLFLSADVCQLQAMSPCIDSGDPGAECLDPDGSRADMGMHGGPVALTDAPPRVTGAVLTDLGGGDWRLDWDASPAGDVQHYLVYRDTASVFAPLPANMVAQVDVSTTSFTDSEPAAGSYYLVQAVDAQNLGSGYSEPQLVGGSDPSAVAGDTLPRRLAISQVVPNPFNPATTIRYDVHRDGPVRLEIFDLRGRLVRQLVVAHRARGSYEEMWRGTDRRGAQVATGVYFARLKADGQSVTTKMVLAK